MATTTYTSSPAAAAFTAKTEASAFIPEIWSDEVIAAYQKNLKMAPLVKKIAMTGKKVTVFTSQYLFVQMQTPSLLTLQLL